MPAFLIAHESKKSSMLSRLSNSPETFKGKQVTVSMLKSKGTRAGLFRDYFDRLNALYVMVALGRARKLKKKLGKAMLFRVK